MQTNGRVFARKLIFLAGVLLATNAGLRAESLDAANKRGENLLSQGLYARAIEAFHAALASGKKEGPEGVGVLRVKHNLAQAYAADGQFALAEQNFKESFEGLSVALNTGRGRVTADEVGWVVLNWGGNCYRLGQFALAEEKAVQAVHIFEGNNLPDSATVARHNLASIYCEEKKYDKALAEYEGVLEFRRQRYGTRDPRYADALAGPGVVYMKMRDYVKAETLFRRCLDGTPGSDPETLENLAFVLTGQGRFEEARHIYESQMVLAQKRYGLPYRVANYKGNLSVIAGYESQWDAAAKLADESERFVIPYRRNMALGMADSELLSYLSLLNTVLGSLDDALSIGWARHATPGMAEKCAGWSINERGLLYESMAEHILLARDSRLGGAQAQFAELTQVRKEYSALLMSGGGSQSAQDYKATLSHLMEREADLTRRMGVAAMRVPPPRDYVEVSALRKGLDRDTVLVHFAKTELRDFSVKGSPHGPKIVPHYIAWVIPPSGKGETSVFDIGPVAAVEAAAQKTNANFAENMQTLEEAYQHVAKLKQEKLPADEQKKQEKEIFATMHQKMAALEQAYREEAVQDLSKLLLHPLLSAAGWYKKWILCPDADLWMLPWNALVMPDGKYFIQEHTLTHIITPRDLVAPPSSQERLGAPLVMTAPNYDLGVTGPENRAHNVDYLHGFGKEWVDKFLPELEVFAEYQARVFTGDQATEEVIKKADRPRVLFLATHGSFGKVDPAQMPPGYGFFKENPLVRSMLVFAGCNRKHPPGDMSEDGFLLGSEVLGCDLRGTELVILTACETAQGDTHAGQSAAGMRQAFQLAGARHVVATLWSVDRQASKKWAESFIAHLAESTPPISALRQAQLERLDDPDTRHPFFWAAFTITGSGR